MGGVQSCQAPFWCIMSHYPILIEPDELEPLLDDDKLLLVDLGKPESYSQIHVPGAMYLDYPLLLAGTKPASGLLPPEERLAHLAGMLKLDSASRVVAYDDEGGGRAARLAWTLHYLGYQSIQVLNGGIHAWNNEGHPVSEDPVFLDNRQTLPVASHDPTVLATRAYVLEHLDDDGVVLLDARTPEEYAGTKAYAARGGHIPGAKNIPFTQIAGRLGELGCKKGAKWDCSNAKTVMLFCNGLWCGQSPTAIHAMLREGYPASKIRYYRNGMQGWESLGLTVVKGGL